jgi:hypothetical protein
MKAQRMMICRMTHTCHLPGLVHMAKDWQVLAAVRHEEIEEEGDGNDGAEGDEEEEDEEIFDVEEINHTSYIHMGTPTFWLPLNSDWKEKISYKGKIDLVRKRGKKI